MEIELPGFSWLTQNAGVGMTFKNLSKFKSNDFLQKVESHDLQKNKSQTMTFDFSHAHPCQYVSSLSSNIVAGR